MSLKEATLATAKLATDSLLCSSTRSGDAKHTLSAVPEHQESTILDSVNGTRPGRQRDRQGAELRALVGKRPQERSTDGVGRFPRCHR